MKNYKYNWRIRTGILMFIFALSMLMLSSTLIVYAEDGVPSAAQIVDGIGKNGAGGSGKIPGGISYTRTGYLCYLVEANGGGSISGMQAKAFRSPGFEKLSGAEWYCHSKKGDYSASEWTGEAKWGCTPFNKDDTTNVEEIKSWMLKKVGDKENGVQFVYDNWGETVATEFANGEYVLVIENILHFQPCIKESSGGKIDFKSEAKKQVQASLISHYMKTQKLTRKQAENAANDKIAQMDKVGLLDNIAEDVREKYIEKYGTDEKGANYKSVAGAVIGTCTDCIDYQHKVGADTKQFRSYTNGVSCLSEYIEPGGAGEKAGFTPYTGAIGKDTRWSDSEVRQYGISMIVISAESGGQTTCDEPKQPKPHKAPNESTGTCDIIKNYRTMDKDGNLLTDDGCFIHKNVANQIEIEDEQTYKVVGWKISTVTKEIESEHWETNVPPTISQHGDKPGTVTLKDKEKSLYVLLEKVEGQSTWDDISTIPSNPPKESDGDYAIVKTYRTVDESGNMISDDGSFSIDNVAGSILIEQEPEYKVKGWKISDTFKDTIPADNWDSNIPGNISQNGTDIGQVILKEPERCLYVLLEKSDKEVEPADVNYTLSQTTITRQIHISAPDNQLTMPKIQDHEFIWKLLGHVVECSGHRCDGHEVTKSGSHDSDCPSDCTSSHSYTDTEYHDNVYCSNWVWFDDKLVFSLKNEQKGDFPDVLATKSGWENVTTLKGLALWVQPFTRTIPEETLKGYKNLDYACVLLRGKDKLTVAEWKNTDLGTSAANSDLKEVSSAGFCVGNTLMGSRKTEDYKDNFTVSIVDNSVDNTTKYGATKDGQAECGQTWSATHTHTIKGIEIEKFDIPVSVQLDVYSGSPDGGINDKTCATGRQNHKVSGYNKSNGIEVKYNGTIDFLPYVQMNYDTYTEKYRTAYVLGEHKRSITPNAYAEISWNETAGENLRISSLQWSTHKSAVDTWGAGNTLPGGAALTLSIPSSDRQKIVLTTYQVILEGSGKTQVENTGGSVGEFTRDKAIELHQAYVDSVVKGYESLCVEQWVNTNTANPAWSSGGKAVHEGDDISFISSGLHASEDSKYYFRKAGEQGNGAGEGDLDVEDHGISLTDTYTFFTNTYGEVRYIKNNVNPNIGNEKMGELASGGMAEFLNKRTHIVDKLTAAVEHGTGQDKSYGIDGMRSKTGVNWYNESFDGVTIIVQQSVITVGFKEPGERTSILDTRLCKPNKNGQSGMFKDGSYSSSQYKCKDHTEEYGVKDKVGTFMNVDVYTESMDMLYKSKIFFIPNVNTQDLH